MSTDDIFIISTVALFVLLFVVAIVSEIMSADATAEPNDYSDIDDDELRGKLIELDREEAWLQERAETIDASDDVALEYQRRRIELLEEAGYMP